MELLFAIMIGMGLSISAGFRVFTPMLVAGIAARIGWLPLGEGFEWLSSTPALIAFSIAVVLEVASYYIPVVDNFMKALSTPLALMAGTLLTVSVIGVDDSPLLSWGLAFVTGGGSATISQLTTATARGASTVTTGGLANPLVSFMEDIGAVILSVLSIVFPLLVGVMFIVLIVVFIKLYNKMRGRPAI